METNILPPRPGTKTDQKKKLTKSLTLRRNWRLHRNYTKNEFAIEYDILDSIAVANTLFVFPFNWKIVISVIFFVLDRFCTQPWRPNLCFQFLPLELLVLLTEPIAKSKLYLVTVWCKDGTNETKGHIDGSVQERRNSTAASNGFTSFSH